MRATTVSPSRPCTACGGLECLCRPRFRAGQVLTESDLNCLEQYVVRKQQRHNLYLHGTGVVCGMKVLCSPHPGWVTVTSGFAIGPCGEEIAIPSDYPLDVCGMIRDCRTAIRKNWSCQPFAAPCVPTVGSSEAEETWYVTVRYDEAEARGIASDCNPCGSPGGCGCGGTGSTSGATGGCGCGGNGGTATMARTATSTRTALRPPSECEPNRICEGYRIEIAPAPAERRPTSIDLIQGTFLRAVYQCAREAANVLAQDPTNRSNWPDANAVLNAHLAFRTAVLAYIAAHPSGDCSAPSNLPDVPRPPTQDEQGQPDIYIDNTGIDKANSALRMAVTLALRGCLCGEVLPPCPTVADDPRLVLAVVTTRGADCKIVDICDVRCRKQLVTVPTLLYWVSIFPSLWAILERVCCGEQDRDRLDFNRATRPGAVPVSDVAPGQVGGLTTSSEEVNPFILLLRALHFLVSEVEVELGGKGKSDGNSPK